MFGSFCLINIKQLKQLSKLLWMWCVSGILHDVVCVFFSTLMCILALFSRLSVVCLVLSGPKGTSFFNCSKYSRSLARLQTTQDTGWVSKHPLAQKRRLHLQKYTNNRLSTRPPKDRNKSNSLFVHCEFYVLGWEWWLNTIQSALVSVLI